MIDTEQRISGRSARRTIRLVAAVCAAVAVAVALGLVAPASAGAADGAPSADTNGDRVFDDLAAQIARLPADARVNVIVRLDTPAVDMRVGTLQALVGDFSVGRVLTLVDAFSATVTKEQVELLRGAPGVVSIEENGVVSVENVPGNADFGVTKARTDVPTLDGEADGTAGTYSKDDLVAAVIDTGIDATHHDLDGGKVLAFADCVSAVCSTPAAYDDHGHGTHVAATIAGTGTGSGQPGVAPRAALVGIKVLNSAGSGTDAGVIAGISWAVTNKATYGIRVLNLSLGAAGCSAGTEAISTAVNNAVAAGLVVVIAAGNSGPAACTVGSPGAAVDAITVGAMADTSQGGFYQAYFSSRGPTLATSGNPARVKPDISAPGYGVTSAAACLSAGACATATHNESSVKSGTSMATPFVVGVVLLMLDATDTLTPAQVKTKIMATAQDWGVAGTDNDYGAGRLDAYAALASAGAALTTPPTVPAHATRSGTVAATASIEYPVNVTSTTYPLAGTVVLQSCPCANTKLEIVDPGGTVRGTSAFGLRQEDTYRSAPTAGTWLVRVGWSGTGSRAYDLDVSGDLGSGAPVNSVVPAVSGTVQAGQTLTSSYGTWTGASPTSYGFQWQRCNAAGASCADISGATSRTYVGAIADVGSTLRSVLTFTNASGTAPATSNVSVTVIAATPPTSTGLPAVSGTPVDGQTLTTTDGTWSGTRTSTTRQWQRCDAAGASCSAIVGATGTTLALVTLDIGSTIRVEVTATNTGSSTVATSAATAVVATLAATAVPTISGTAQDGQTLTATNGTWVGTSPTFTAQWQRCNASGASCSAIAGATSSSFGVTATDIGSTLRYAVSGTNAGGTVTATSAATAVVTAAPPPAPPPAPAAASSSGGGGGGGGGGGSGAGGIDPNLEVTISTERPSVVNIGDSFRYIIRTTNLGPGGAQGINLIVDLPAELELTGSEVDRGSGCTGAGTAQLSCFLDFLTPPQAALVKLTVRARSGTQLTLVARATLDQRDFDPLNNVASSVIALGEPAVRPPAPGLPPVSPPGPAAPPIRILTTTEKAAAVKAVAVKVATAKAKVATTKANQAAKAAASAKARETVAKAEAAKAKKAVANAVGAKAKQAAVRVAAAKAVAVKVASAKARKAAVKAAAAKAAAVKAAAAAARTRAR